MALVCIVRHLLQIVAIIIVAQGAKSAGLVTFPDISKDQVVKVTSLQTENEEMEVCVIAKW